MLSYIRPFPSQLRTSRSWPAIADKLSPENGRSAESAASVQNQQEGDHRARGTDYIRRVLVAQECEDQLLEIRVSGVAGEVWNCLVASDCYCLFQFRKTGCSTRVLHTGMPPLPAEERAAAALGVRATVCGEYLTYLPH